MSSDHDVRTADLEKERLLAPLKNAKLEGVGKGKLSLTNQRIEFETRSGFLSPPHVEFSVDLPSISSAKFKDEWLTLEWANEERLPVVRRLQLPKGDAATNLCRALSNALKLLRYEAELRERRTRYRAFLWRTAHRVWVLGSLLVQVVEELTRERWDAIDGRLAEARETAGALAAEGAIDVVEPLEPLAETVSSRDAPLILRRVVSTVEAVSASLNNELPLAAEWKELAREDSSGLGWRDMRYVFLFASRYGLLSLWQQLDETGKIDESLPRLVRLSSLLGEKTSVDSPLSGMSGEEEAAQVIARIDTVAQGIEDSLKINAGTA